MPLVLRPFYPTFFDPTPFDLMPFDRSSSKILDLPFDPLHRQLPLKFPPLDQWPPQYQTKPQPKISSSARPQTPVSLQRKIAKMYHNGPWFNLPPAPKQTEANHHTPLIPVPAMKACERVPTSSPCLPESAKHLPISLMYHHPPLQLP
jgi:hypothetical protein